MEKLEELMNSIEKQEKEKAKNDYLRYFRNWYWFVISVGFALFVAFILYKAAPSTYMVQSRLIINNNENKISSELSFEEPIRMKKTGIHDQVGILSSYSVVSRAIENLNWKTTWYKKGILSKTELYKNTPFDVITQAGAHNLTGTPIEITALNNKEYLVIVKCETRVNGVERKVQFEEKAEFNKPFKNDFFHFTLSNKKDIQNDKYYLVFNNTNSLTSSYQKKMEIIAEPQESELVIIQAEGQIPQKEADFLNEVANIFIQFDIESKSVNSENSVSFIEEQASEVRANLKLAEEKINNFRREKGLVDLGQEANVIYSSLSQIEAERFEAKQLLQFYQNLKINIGNSEMINQISPPASLQNSDNGLSQMLSELKGLYTRREVLALSVKKSSPNFQRLEREIEVARSGIKNSLDNYINNATREMQNINSRYNSVQSRLSRLPESEKNLISMQRDFDVNNNLYNFLLQKKAEASIKLASIAPQAKIIDPALSEYAQKVGPVLMIYFFGGIFIGIIIPFLIITFTGFFNNRIESVKDIESNSEIPVLAEIIHHKYKDNLPVMNHPRSGITESFRNLKVKINKKFNDPRNKVISINSLVSGEGKSFISTNFAATLSLSNRKTLLVGTDLRSPTLHKFLGVKSGKGLSSFLNNDCGFDEIVCQSPSENLHYVLAGDVPNNPSELLENGMFEQFLNIARQRFDYIVLDNAPIKLVPDAHSTCIYSDINLFILRLKHSRQDEIHEINKMVAFNEIKNSFIIINDAPHHAYGYGNKYWRKGYGNYRKTFKIA